MKDWMSHSAKRSLLPMRMCVSSRCCKSLYKVLRLIASSRQTAETERSSVTCSRPGGACHCLAPDTRKGAQPFDPQEKLLGTLPILPFQDGKDVQRPFGQELVCVIAASKMNEVHRRPPIYLGRHFGGIRGKDSFLDQIMAARSIMAAFFDPPSSLDSPAGFGLEMFKIICLNTADPEKGFLHQIVKQVQI